jgi:hypothetical protein
VRKEDTTPAQQARLKELLASKSGADTTEDKRDPGPVRTAKRPTHDERVENGLKRPASPFVLALITDLKKSLADDTLAVRLRYWKNFDLLIIDEFGFERLERQSCVEAPQLLYKVIEGRCSQRSTVLVTNVGFEAWGDYLGDAPLAMAFLDRLVDGAVVLKLRGRLYRAARAKNLDCDQQQDKPSKD